jgi:hypothetical protein
MAADPEMRAGFIGCLFLLLCVISATLFSIEIKLKCFNLKCSKKLHFFCLETGFI